MPTLETEQVGRDWANIKTHWAMLSFLAHVLLLFWDTSQDTVLHQSWVLSGPFHSKQSLSPSCLLWSYLTLKEKYDYICVCTCTSACYGIWWEWGSEENLRCQSPPSALLDQVSWAGLWGAACIPDYAKLDLQLQAVSCLCLPSHPSSPGLQTCVPTVCSMWIL